MTNPDHRDELAKAIRERDAAIENMQRADRERETAYTRADADRAAATAQLAECRAECERLEGVQDNLEALLQDPDYLHEQMRLLLRTQ